MAGLGAGLQSFGSSAMQMLAQREQQKREEELRKQQAKLQDFNMGLQLEDRGYRDLAPYEERLGKLRSAAEAMPAFLDAPGAGVLPAGDMLRAAAGGTERMMQDARSVPMFDGTTRRMVLDPTKTPEAVAMQKLREQEALRRESALSEYKAKTDFEMDKLAAARRGDYEALQRAGYIAPDEPFDPQRNYTTDVALARLQSTNQNRLDVAKTPRTSFSTSTRTGGGGSGSGPGSLDAGERARLSQAEVARRTASGAYGRTLANRPQSDPLLTDEENVARQRQWAAGDSTFAANELKGAETDLAQVRTELGIASPGAAGAGGTTNPTASMEAALAMRAQMKIREIMGSDHSPQEKQAMVQQVNAILAQELRKLRGGR